MHPGARVTSELIVSDRAEDRPAPGAEFAADVEGGGRVRLSGELDRATAPKLEASLAQLVGADGDIAIDLAALVFLGAAGVNVFVAAARDLGGRGRVVLLDPPPRVARVLELTGLDQIVAVAGTD